MLRGRSSFQQHYDSFITMDNSLANIYSSSFWACWVREDLQLKSHRWCCESHTGHSLMSCKRWFYWQPPCFVSLHICGYPTAILLFWDLSPEVRLQSHWPRDQLAASWQALGHYPVWQGVAGSCWLGKISWKDSASPKKPLPFYWVPADFISHP